MTEATTDTQAPAPAPSVGRVRSPATPASRARASFAFSEGRLYRVQGKGTFVATHAALLLSIDAGHVPGCVPYVTGCTSISRAARSTG